MSAKRKAVKAAAAAPAAVDPVARVLVDVPLAHLDRPFDYLVPAAMADDALPGTRVKVRFAGQEVGGYLLARGSDPTTPAGSPRCAGSSAPSRCSARPWRRSPATLAERYAGTRSDVLRLAVPPRHAGTERAEPVPAADPPPYDADAAAAAWARAPAGRGVPAPPGRGGVAAGPSGRPRRGRTGRRCSPTRPRRRTPARDAASCSACPTPRTSPASTRALTDVLGTGHHVTLTAQPGPARRYRDFLAVSRGARRVVVGTRAAAFAPVHDLGLVVIWDDGDDLHAEPRAPYPHTRETLLLRAEREGSAALVGGFARSVEADHLLGTGLGARAGACPGSGCATG